LQALLLKPDFIDSLWVCSLELLLFTHSSERSFPWSAVEVAQLPPVHFCRIIELVIRAEPQLSREMVKHLSRVEERVLEELAWTADSPLWAALAKLPSGVPSYGQICGSNGQQQQEGSQQQSFGGRQGQSPMKHHPGAKRGHHGMFVGGYGDQEMDQGGDIDVEEPKPKRQTGGGAGGGFMNF